VGRDKLESLGQPAADQRDLTPFWEEGAGVNAGHVQLPTDLEGDRV
jgi:hypothetical protein